MGCDIHWYSETYDPDSDVWVCDQAEHFEVMHYDCGDGDVQDEPAMEYFPSGDRDYYLFGLLAGVRGRWPWSFEPKGFPEDASQEVQECYEHWDSDGHTPSWLTLTELKAKLAELEVDLPQLKTRLLLLDKSHGMDDEALQNIKDYHALKLDKLIQDLKQLGPAKDRRLVFWFDN